MEQSIWNSAFSWHWSPENQEWISMRYKCAATVAPVEPSTPLPSSVARPTLRAVTYNVLFDKFESDRIRTSERHPVVCEVLRRTQADVMVLCEATASFAAVLLACPWVRERYWVSDCPGGATLGECGQLILSRFPMAVQVAALSRYKMAVVASVSFGTVGELSVGGVHLPSNFADVLDGSLGVSAALQRRRQTMLALVAHLVQRSELQMIAGDFNYDPEKDAQCSDPPGWLDGGREAGPTFDSAANPTARITSRAPKQRRYDRLLVRGLSPYACHLAGTSPLAALGGLCPSDHYCVVSTFTLAVTPVEYASVAALLAAQKTALGVPELESQRRYLLAAEIESSLNRTTAVVGSTRLGCVLRSGDLDVGIAGVWPLSNVEQSLLISKGFEIEGGEENTFRMRKDGVEIEMQALDPGAVADAERLLGIWEEKTPMMREVLIFLKVWAQRSGVYGTVFGFPNGLALAVLATHAALSLPRHEWSSMAIVEVFFRDQSEWNQQSSISVSSRVFQPLVHDHLPIGTPLANRSICRSATAASAAQWRQAVRTARSLLPEGLGALLLQDRDAAHKPLFFSSSDHYLHIEWISRVAVARLPALVVYLLKAGLQVRVWSQLWSHENNNPCVWIATDRVAPRLCASVLPPGCVVSVHLRPSPQCCFRPFRHRTAPKEIEEIEERENDEQQEEEIEDDGNDNNAMSAEWLHNRLADKDAPAVFAAMQWDPTFEKCKCEIGWDDRFLGLMRKAVARFTPDKIPWHRVVVFYYANEVVWSRPLKLQQLLDKAPPKK